MATEYNFDGLVGPTHNYADLSIIDNLASMKNKKSMANPRIAALEGLEKMKFLMNIGFQQGVLPPHARPDLDFLGQMGFSGSAEKMIHDVQKISDSLLATCYAASSMWVANSGVVSPSADTQDAKVHFTPANLNTCLHRSLEPKQTAVLLKKIFADPRFFVHHLPIPSHSVLSDEGAANHLRFCSDYGSAGVEVFVYGRESFSDKYFSSTFYPRQAKAASQLIIFKHQLSPERTFLIKQHPKAIAAGAFHNDVICSADRNLLFYHELSFANESDSIQKIKTALAPSQLLQIRVQENQISLEEAIKSYLFNSQLLPAASKTAQWILVASDECKKIPAVRDYLEQLVTKKSLIQKVYFVSVRQSMLYGGGPACLRLRVVLNKEESKSMHQGVRLTPALYQQIKVWITKHYRDRLAPSDLSDPMLIKEGEEALDELTQILKLKNIYPFQR